LARVAELRDVGNVADHDPGTVQAMGVTMCIKAGNSEMSSVKALMTFGLDAVVFEVFGMEPTEIRPELRVYEDLGMTDAQAIELSELVAEYFDGVQLELTPMTTIGEIFDRVVEREFVGVPADAF
jgi:hypothetical protein